ncbi:MAG: DUF1772 domain-containing protein [Planctomycetota bacterium]
MTYTIWFAAELLNALLAGFLFAFAVVVMPGIRSLPDRDFLRAFQRIDGVIQRGSPAFLLVWLGSAVSLIGVALVAFLGTHGEARWLLAGAAVAHVVGVQLPTMTINIPLNNCVQAADLDTLEDNAVADLRAAFEPRWNRWNLGRTSVACVIAAVLASLP